MMPKEIEYAPPFIIRVLDKRDFGRLPMVGVNIIKSLEQFRVDPIPEASSLMRRTSESLIVSLCETAVHTHSHIVHSTGTIRSKGGPDRKVAPVVLEDPNDALNVII